MRYQAAPRPDTIAGCSKRPPAAFSALCRAHVLPYAPRAKLPAALLDDLFEQLAQLPVSQSGFQICASDGGSLRLTSHYTNLKSPIYPEVGFVPGQLCQRELLEVGFGDVANTV